MISFLLLISINKGRNEEIYRCIDISRDREIDWQWICILKNIYLCFWKRNINSVFVCPTKTVISAPNYLRLVCVIEKRGGCKACTAWNGETLAVKWHLAHMEKMVHVSVVSRKFNVMSNELCKWKLLQPIQSEEPVCFIHLQTCLSI